MSLDVASAPPATTGRERGGALVGTGTLVRFMLRRDRIRIPAWGGGLMLFALYVVTALEEVLEGESLAGTVQLFHQPVGRLLTGPAYGFEDPTLERFVAGGYGLYFLILAALMSILLVVRHTRVEEQTGRAELIRANVVGRHAGLTATVIVAAISNAVVALLVFVTMIGVGDFGAGGSLLFAAGIAATGMAFAGVAALTAQLTEYSRAASGMAGVVLGIAFALRAVGDMAEQGGTALSWASPLAWGQQTAPFVLDRWWPLALLLGFAVVTTALGYLVSSRRDLAASIFAVRPGAAEAAPSLGTPLGLAFRLQRASIIGWTAALGVAGLIFGGYADALVDADLPAEFADIFGAQDMVAGYMAFMPLFMGYFAAAFAILAVQSFRGEETVGRTEPVLATPVSRVTWMGANLAVTAGGALVVLLAAGLATGVGAALVSGDGAHVGEQLLAHLNQLPAVLTVLGIAALLFGVLPRAIGVAWALVAYGFFAGTFASMLELPEGLVNLSPFEHAAQIPLESFELAPLIGLVMIGAAGVVLGLLGFRRRDLYTT